MDLEESRLKQRAAQQQAQTQPDGVARIGDRDPLTGRYTVQFPDGGIGANGIKTYTAMSKPGDVVVLFPRADGSIAIDSEKGNPTIVPDVFNKPVEDKKKAKVWILYFFGGKLWVGGHQSEPEEVGSVYLRGTPPPILEVDGGPGLILSLGNSSNLHVWGDDSGWVATYQTFPPNFDFTSATTFHAVTSTTRKKYSTSFGFSEDGGMGGNNQDGIDYNERAFPLGSGFVSYRSIRDISSIIPEIIYDTTVSQTSSAVHQVSIGYMENAVPTVNQFSSSVSRSSIVYSGILTNETISYSGTIPIPNQNRQTTLPYSGSFSCPEQSSSGLGPYFNSAQNVVYPELSAQIVHSYPILCDRGATYYIQESVIISGTSSIQKLYELRSTISQEIIARNYTEPRFFGIRWDIRASALVGGVWPESTATDRYKYVKYSDTSYYYPFYSFDSTYHGNSVLPVGHFNTLPDNVLPIDEYRFYPYFVTFSGGQVVTISASEISKAKIGSAYLQRRSVSANGVFTDLGTTFCHPIPSTAIVYHWSTTA